jgi:hypothetical protein
VGKSGIGTIRHRSLLALEWMDLLKQGKGEPTSNVILGGCKSLVKMGFFSSLGKKIFL